jgi:hypothetical protein
MIVDFYIYRYFLGLEAALKKEIFAAIRHHAPLKVYENRLDWLSEVLSELRSGNLLRAMYFMCAEAQRYGIRPTEPMNCPPEERLDALKNLIDLVESRNNKPVSRGA